MSEPLLEISHLKKFFPVHRGFVDGVLGKRQKYVRAVNDVSFRIIVGETFGLIGESGSGKTTIARIIMGLITPSDGRIIYRGKEINFKDQRTLHALRLRVQMIFQDPFGALDSKMKVFDIVKEPLVINKPVKPDQMDQITNDVLSEVKLPAEIGNRYPFQLSGGQLQRVALARALVLRAELIVADEPTSMLDVSVRGQILQLMNLLKSDHEVSFLFISHDIALARNFCDRIAVMYHGSIVEIGTTQEIIFDPLHPYTKALIAAVPRPVPGETIAVKIKSGREFEDIDGGCIFSGRCPYSDQRCRSEPQILREVRGHFVACYKAETLA